MGFLMVCLKFFSGGFSEDFTDELSNCLSVDLCDGLLWYGFYSVLIYPMITWKYKIRETK